MTTFFRLLHHDDKPAALRAAVAALHEQQPPADTYTVDPASFAQVPGSPFAYWVSEKVLGLFDEFPRLHPDWGELVRGPEVFDLEESVRFWIEVPTNQIGVSKLWCYYAKGGQFRRFASDIHLVVDYGRVRDGQKEFRRPGDDAFYFISGITYTQRTTSVFNARVLPGDSLTSPKGPAIVSSSDQNKVLALLAIVNSTCFSKLVELRVGAADGAARSYDLGILRNVPIPDESVVLKTHLNQITKDSISLGRVCKALVAWRYDTFDLN